MASRGHGEYEQIPLAAGRRHLLPVRLIRIILGARRLHPSPWIYIAAAVLGSSLGVAAQIAFGWPWWLVALLAVVAVALFFLSTAFWGHPQRRDLGTQLLRELSPSRARARTLRQQADLFRNAPFPLYGLPPSWQGLRHLASSASGWGVDMPFQIEALGLGHGDPADTDGGYLHVETMADDSDPATRRRDLAEWLWMETEEGRGQSTAGDWVQMLWARPDPAWSSVTITVDGLPVEFAWFREADCWAAQADLDGCAVLLRAHRISLDAVELVRIADVEPYVRGEADLLARAEAT